ncbi:MAG: hypothetical protein Phog2KO_16190 [Phototrophicaceae bacterium]
MRQQEKFFNSALYLTIFAIIMYILPWTLNNNAVLSLGAYDFAELLAKRQFNDLSYNTVLALRGQLVLLTCLFAFSIQRPLFTVTWCLKAVLCMLLVIAQLPPLTYIQNLGDANQQQQALLAFNSLVAVGFGLTGLLSSAKYYAWIVISIVGILTTIYALINALDIITAYSVNMRIGVGGIGLIIVYVIIGLYSMRKIIKNNRATQ